MRGEGVTSSGVPPIFECDDDVPAFWDRNPGYWDVRGEARIDRMFVFASSFHSSHDTWTTSQDGRGQLPGDARRSEAP